MTATLHRTRRENVVPEQRGPENQSVSKGGLAQALEKRKEPRRPARGTVHIVRGNPARTEILGHLIDISASGFRAAHFCATMTSGEVVGYIHARDKGHARVVWTRLTTGANPAVESGFVVLAET